MLTDENEFVYMARDAIMSYDAAAKTDSVLVNASAFFVSVNYSLTRSAALFPHNKVYNIKPLLLHFRMHHSWTRVESSRGTWSCAVVWSGQNVWPSCK